MKKIADLILKETGWYLQEIGIDFNQYVKLQRTNNDCIIILELQFNKKISNVEELIGYIKNNATL